MILLSVWTRQYSSASNEGRQIRMKTVDVLSTMVNIFKIERAVTRFLLFVDICATKIRWLSDPDRDQRSSHHLWRQWSVCGCPERLWFPRPDHCCTLAFWKQNFLNSWNNFRYTSSAIYESINKPIFSKVCKQHCYGINRFPAYFRLMAVSIWQYFIINRLQHATPEKLTKTLRFFGV